jgi:hypothetical protein
MEIKPIDGLPSVRAPIGDDGVMAASGGCWKDSTSKSITMNSSQMLYEDSDQIYRFYFDWGRKELSKCLVNSTDGGVLTCSVANVVRVSYYSREMTFDSNKIGFKNCVYHVSWRDASGVAHDVDHPDINLCHSWQW